MLRFVSARIRNFVIFEDVEIEFAASSGSPITVIRAENGSGKTTMMRALEWALYGSSALPTKGKYDIHPVFIQPADCPAELSVEIRFQVSVDESKSNNGYRAPEEYTLIRKADINFTEDHGFRVTAKSPILVRHEDEGDKTVEDPEYLIDGWLPPSLREFFFTDGDAALAYIAAEESSTRRKRVEGAVRALLHLDLVEKVLKRLRKNTIPEIRKAAAKASGQESLEELTRAMEIRAAKIDVLESEIETLTEGCNELSEREASLDRKLKAALEKGNREELKNQLEETERDHKAARERKKTAYKELSQLLAEPELEMLVLQDLLAETRKTLEPLQSAGKIPATHVHFLRERLELGKCVCGTDISKGTPGYVQVQEQIASAQADTDTSNRLSEIFYESGEYTQRITRVDNGWPSRVGNVIDREGKASEEDKRLGNKLAALDIQIKSLPDVDIKTVREHLELVRDSEKEELRKLTLRTKERDDLLAEQRSDEEERARLQSKNEKAESWARAERAATDIENVLSQTISVLQEEKVAEVSKQMDKLFREMIVAEEENALIVKAALTKDFDIRVLGQKGRVLNPDTELNGASRRALTLAFILALARVSGVQAPNVVDTPLGMTSGPTRKKIYEVASREAYQLVLFLTRSEIEGIEALLDASVGRAQTMTTMAQYPTQVVNLSAKELVTIVCDCDHRQFCKLCERVGDRTGTELKERTADA